MRRAPARPVRACFVPSCCTDVVQEHDLRATPAQCNAKGTLSSHLTLALRTPHFTASQIMWALLTPSHLIPSLLTCHLSKFFSTVFISSEHWSTSWKFFSTHLSPSARQKVFTVRQKSISHKNIASRKTFSTQKLGTQINLHRKAFTKFFVLQSLHTALPTTTLYYEACTEYFPVLLCTTNLAQSTGTTLYCKACQKKVLPRITLYYKACTKHVPVLLCIT